MNVIFDYYLDAWNHCRLNKIELSRIKKLNFRKWYVESEPVQMEINYENV